MKAKKLIKLVAILSIVIAGLAIIVDVLKNGSNL